MPRGDDIAPLLVLAFVVALLPNSGESTCLSIPIPLVGVFCISLRLDAEFCVLLKVMLCLFGNGEYLLGVLERECLRSSLCDFVEIRCGVGSSRVTLKFVSLCVSIVCVSESSEFICNGACTHSLSCVCCWISVAEDIRDVSPACGRCCCCCCCC